MARLTLVSSIIFVLCCVAGASTFGESNPIQMVSDGLRGFQSSVLNVIGHTRHALSFARFAYNQHPRSVVNAAEFADWSWEEFQKHMLGASQNCSATLKGSHQLTDVVLPESKDWRETGIVSPVKDQGKCGSCCTFSLALVFMFKYDTTGALEAAYHQAFGEGISLSEQQLVDCAGAFDNNGCNGGLPSHAFEYIKHNGGLDTEEAYPYTAKDGVCKFSSANVGVKSLTMSTLPCTSQDVNHAVLAVGYGVENGVPYWLIKNSRGADWG
ncbi:Cysteine proteinase 3 [Hibiscus syriacus]|uniref:Cysteine proteinase 3 n=1 Tax=Hibiscus syriacus TaxID=106335 RepID=A0A6A2YAA0_HIBSY|nr:Cysteine proteinase 3 [Hibiscus syriacus]